MSCSHRCADTFIPLLSVAKKTKNQKKHTVLPARGVCHPSRRPLNTAALRAASGLTCANQLPAEGGPRRAATVGSKQKGSARFFLELSGKRAALKPQFLLGPPSVVEHWSPQDLFFYSAKNSTQTVKWRFRCLLRFSTYQQHPKPNCYASCRVLTPAGHCDSCCLFFGRSSIQGTAVGGCSWNAFPTFLVVVYLPRGHSGCSKEPNGVSLIIPSRVQLCGAATRET